MKKENNYQITVLHALCLLVQVVIKMIALTPKGYWTSRRNRFDMLLTFLGIIWIILHFTFNLTGQEVEWIRIGHNMNINLCKKQKFEKTECVIKGAIDIS